MRTLLNLSDEDIVARVTAGDTKAYGELMARYEQKLLRYVVYLIHNRASANDIVQETFIKTYQNLKGFNQSYKFSSWIYRIAHNETMNTIKKNKHLSDIPIDELPTTDYQPHFDDAIDHTILKNNVSLCMSELDPKYREIIQLIYFENMKYSDASDVLHIPSSTVGVWLSRAKQKLREICKKKGVHHE